MLRPFDFTVMNVRFRLKWLENSADFRDWDTLENEPSKIEALEKIRQEALSIFGKPGELVLINYVQQTDMLTHEGVLLVQRLIKECDNLTSQSLGPHTAAPN